MPLGHTTQVEIAREHLLKIMEQVGSEAAAQVRKLYDEGELVYGQKVTVFQPVGHFHVSSPNLLARISMKVASDDSCQMGNTGLAAGGVAIVGISGLRFAYARDQKARFCYAMSMVFGTCGIAGGTTAAIAKACHLSKTAMVSDACGFVFMKIGDEAQRLAEKIESRPVRARRPLGFGTYTNRGNSAFIMPSTFSTSSFISKIPFEKIGRGVGVALTVYGYSKITITVYRYGKQLILRYRNRKFRKGVQFFIGLTYLECRAAKIYRFAAIKTS